MNKFIKNPAERTRFLKFCVVGATGFVVDVVVTNLMLHLTGMTKLSVSIGFFVAAVSNFIWNHFWVYPDSREKPLTQQFGQFLLINVIGWGIRWLLFFFFDNPIIGLVEKVLSADFSYTLSVLGHELTLTPNVIGHNITLVIAVAIVMMWNFLANRLWTYNDVK